MVFREAGSKNVIEGGGSEIFEAWVVAPGESVFQRGGVPCVMEASFDHILDGGAEGELAVVVAIEISTDDPADNFFTGELFAHFIFVSDDLTDRFGAGGGDVFRAFRCLAAAVAAQVDAINHDQATIGMFESGESKSALKAGKASNRFERFLPCRVEFELGGYGALLWGGGFSIELHELGDHMDF